MLTGRIHQNAESSQFPPAQQIGSTILAMFAVPPKNWQQGSSILSWLLNGQPLNNVCHTAFTPSIIGSSSSTPVSGKNVQDDGIVTVQVCKRQSRQSTKVLIVLSAELTALSAKASSEREKQLYNKQINLKIPSYSHSEDS